MTKSARGFALGVALVAVTTSCGLSNGAVNALRSGQQLGVSGNGTTAGAAGSAGAAAGGAGTVGTGAGGLTGGSAGGSSATSGASGGTATSGTSGAAATSGSTSSGTTGGTSGTRSGAVSGSQASYEQIGITPTTIYLGLHAPATGAAPVPNAIFSTGTKLFWENHKLFGRRVIVNFMDDEYNASHARLVCEELARQDFLVVGGAGTDQIQACASDPVLEASHTPYLSVGVTTNGLNGLPDYFAVSQSYAAQTPETWSLANKLYPTNARQKWAIVTEATPNFDDVTSAMANVLSQNGISYCIIRPPKYYGSSDVTDTMSKIESCTGSLTTGTVFIDTDPNFWIALIKQANNDHFADPWVGVGLTMGFNVTGQEVCSEQPTVKAAFMSPYPALDHQPPGFVNENNPPPDPGTTTRDLEMLIYGVNRATYYMLSSLGSIQNLTRDNFIAMMPRFAAAYGLNGQPLDVIPSLNYNGGHFGSTGAWREQLNCAAPGSGPNDPPGPQYVTIGNLPVSS